MRTGESKPEIPYTPGKQLLVRSHEPSVPTRLINCSNLYESARERERVHPLDRCLLHPPMEGRLGQTQLDLRINRLIRVGDNKRAQVVVVQVQSSTSSNLPKGIILVAKIYDPLYFTDQDDADPFVCMDRDYRSETAAYNSLHELQGDIIPKFYGSFTFNLPVKVIRSRAVRLTLLELIHGRSMTQLNPAEFSRSERQKIMKQVIDAESLIYQHNILHMDMRSSNVIICRDQTGKILRLVIIDFGQCFIGRHPVSYLFPEKDFLEGVSISPLLRWKSHRDTFDPWVDWNWTSWLNKVYESTKPSITAHMRSIWDP